MTSRKPNSRKPPHSSPSPPRSIFESSISSPFPPTLPKRPSSEAAKHTSLTRTLKSLRLTHPYFAPLPTPYLFSHLTLPLWGPGGLLRLHNVSIHPHLARHVQHIKFWVQFNLAEPHPAPFQEGNLRRAAEDLLGAREPPPRKRDKFRRSVSEKFEGLSLGKKRTSKGRKGKSIEEDSAAVRSDSVVSASSNDGEKLERKQSILPPLPDPAVDPMEFLKTFDRMASTTISRNLASAELHFAAERNAGPSPMLKAMVTFMNDIFGKLSRLQTLCVDSQTQEEFMERLDRGFALRYAPTQDTWDAISRYVIAMVLAGWVKSECTGVRRLWVLGGAVGTWEVLMREYLGNKPNEEEVVWRDNGIERGSEMSPDGDGNEARTGLEMWKQKAARLESLSVKYDVGAYRVYFASVETQWMGTVRELMQDMPRLQYLEIGKQKRADGNMHDRSGWTAVRLSNVGAQKRLAGGVSVNLKLLRIGDVQVGDTTELKNCLEALGGEGLERLMMGNFELGMGDWPSAWKMLRDGCQFKLKEFVVMGNTYGSARGHWEARPPLSGREDEDPKPLIWDVQEYVEHKREYEQSPLLLAAEVGATAAVEQWRRRGDATLKYYSSQ